MSGYHDLSLFYDKIIGQQQQEMRAKYYISLFEKHGNKFPKTMLDLACGSMGTSIAFLQRGADVIGVDASTEMLSLASTRLDNAGFSTLLICQDMRNLDLYGTVEAAICTMDGLNHLCNVDDVTTVLKKLMLFIEPNGLFIFDVNTPFKHEHILSDNVFVFEENDFFAVWQNYFEKETYKVNMQLDFFLKNNQLYERLQDTVCEQAYSINIWQKLLNKSGFVLVNAYNDMTLESASDTNEKWTIVAKRINDKGEKHE